jgi:hypothetical protein
MGIAAAAVPAGAVTFGFAGQFANDTPTPGPSASCAAGQILVDFNPGNSTAVGTSNLGAFGPSATHCIAPGTPYAGVFSFDFASGNVLSGTTAGYMTPTVTPGVANSFVTFTATGGTGFFLGASGTIAGQGLLDRRPLRPLNQLSLNGVLNLPAVAVPEPASWALMIAGFGVVGAAQRRARRRGTMAASEHIA